MLELLSPVGNFESLKAAVQNGADCVYFGANLFSARAFASNFDLPNLEKAIQYAKLRGVKTNLTLNTLIKNEEFQEAINLASKAYEFGIDAIIVQDLGLATKLIELFPDLPIHASTQMSIHNLQGVLELEKLGFKRVVLSRELSMHEIEYICKNSKIEIECFIHGALCISYSGQCLFSSIIGGRSGNRGKCAGPCRLPFDLLENNKKIDSGYLLSTRDLCGLEFIPFLINAGVKCLKIEGRMKSPQYVATITRIYRKYINLALSNKPYEIDENDKKELLQVFNRGMFSTGHLDKSPNKNLVFKEKPNNTGLFLGIVQKYNKVKGYITLKLKENIQIGDTISLEKEISSYKISELMDTNQKNIIETSIGQTVIIGRMKGNINPGDRIFKMSSKILNDFATESFNQEKKRILLNCSVIIKKNIPISINITPANNMKIFKDLNITCYTDYCPVEAKNQPLSEETVINQISKTASTPFDFKKIDVDLDDNLFLPKLRILNELRRNALQQVEEYISANIKRKNKFSQIKEERNFSLKSFFNLNINKKSHPEKQNLKISLLLNILNPKFDYSKLNKIDRLYIPLKYFSNKNYTSILEILSKKFDTYIYIPTIVKSNYKNLIQNSLERAVEKYNINGFVISNISNLEILSNFINNKDLTIVSNYTFNVFNYPTIMELKKLGIDEFTLSPELDKKSLTKLCNISLLPKELIVYGNLPLMNINYCLLGQSNKCYPDCKTQCSSGNTYYLNDRLNMKFRIIPDNIQTVSTIYNSKITSISPSEFDINYARIDILDENIEKINHIIKYVKSGKKFEGKDFTSGNLNKKI